MLSERCLSKEFMCLFFHFTCSWGCPARVKCKWSMRLLGFVRMNRQPACVLCSFIFPFILLFTTWNAEVMAGTPVVVLGLLKCQINIIFLIFLYLGKIQVQQNVHILSILFNKLNKCISRPQYFHHPHVLSWSILIYHLRSNHKSHLSFHRLILSIQNFTERSYTFFYSFLHLSSYTQHNIFDNHSCCCISQQLSQFGG